MIASSPTIKMLCLCASATLLVAAGKLATPHTPLELECGGEAMQARLGSSFADMSAGTMTAENSPDETPPQTPPDQTQQPLPVETPAVVTSVAARMLPVQRSIPSIQPVQATSRSAPDAVHSPVSTTTADTTIHATSVRSSATAHHEALAQITPTVAAQALRPSQPSQPQNTTKEATPQILSATEPENVAPSIVMRPRLRDPAQAGQTVAARSKERASQDKPRQQSNPRVQSGNAKRNNTQGAETGSRTARAATQGATRNKAQQSGDAAASNYPGQVMRRIARVPKPRVNNRGTAVISFSVAVSGGLAGASVARSSGSATLDQAALAVVRQASPFPRPPAGAQRRFSIRIEGR